MFDSTAAISQDIPITLLPEKFRQPTLELIGRLFRILTGNAGKSVLRDNPTRQTPQTAAVAIPVKTFKHVLRFCCDRLLRRYQEANRSKATFQHGAGIHGKRSAHHLSTITVPPPFICIQSAPFAKTNLPLRPSLAGSNVHPFVSVGPV